MRAIFLLKNGIDSGDVKILVQFPENSILSLSLTTLIAWAEYFDGYLFDFD